ncbi:hypothetical protein BD413DRAFT_500782 [Trametes elegans]|nr:hypothetical protein BD413DRAFT_500782 [Trametes elegans]
MPIASLAFLSVAVMGCPLMTVTPSSRLRHSAWHNRERIRDFLFSHDLLDLRRPRSMHPSEPPLVTSPLFHGRRMSIKSTHMLVVCASNRVVCGPRKRVPCAARRASEGPISDAPGPPRSKQIWGVL